MGMKFLNKKGWHTGSLRNVEKVWKAEQTHAQEQNKLEELRKQIQEEREKSEYRLLQEQAGLVPRQERLDFLYESGLGVGKGSSEGFKALEEPPVPTSAEANASSSKSGAPGALFEDNAKPQSANDSWRKLHSDPLLQIRQREQEALARIKNNPIKMAMIKKSVEAEKKKKEEKKDKKKKKKHKRHHDSDQSSGDERVSRKRESRKSKNKKEYADGDEDTRERKHTKPSSDSEEDFRERKRDHEYRERKPIKPSEDSDGETRERKRDYEYRERKHTHDRDFSKKSDSRNSYRNERDGRSRQNQDYSRNSDSRTVYNDDRERRSSHYNNKHERENMKDREIGSERERNRELGSERESRAEREKNKEIKNGGLERKTRVSHKRGGVQKMTAEEREERLRQMQVDAEIHEEQRWKRIKKADQDDQKEAIKSTNYKGKNFLDEAQKSIFGAERGGSSTIEESVKRRAYYSQGGGADSEVNAFRR